MYHTSPVIWILLVVLTVVGGVAAVGIAVNDRRKALGSGKKSDPLALPAGDTLVERSVRDLRVNDILTIDHKDFLVEGTMFAVGILLYTRRFPARNLVGRWAFIGLLVLVTFIWASGPFSPPPPNVTAIGFVGLLFGLMTVPWLVWIERHRSS